MRAQKHDRRERKVAVKKVVPCDFNPRLSPYGHCAGCFGVVDDNTTHYQGTSEHPFSEEQARNYETGRAIDAISSDI